MASRSLVLAVTFALVAAAPLAGCLDKFFGRGELSVVFRVSDAPSFTVNDVNYVNANAEFTTANMLVSQVKIWPKGERSGDIVQANRHDVEDFVDLAGEGARERELLNIPMAEGELEQMSLLTLPFRGTLQNGTQVNVSIIEQPDLWEYVIRKPATIEGGETTVYAMSFMIARRAGDTSGAGYFLAVPPDESGPR